MYDKHITECAEGLALPLMACREINLKYYHYKCPQKVSSQSQNTKFFTQETIQISVRLWAAVVTWMAPSSMQSEPTSVTLCWSRYSFGLSRESDPSAYTHRCSRFTLSRVVLTAAYKQEALRPNLTRSFSLSAQNWQRRLHPSKSVHVKVDWGMCAANVCVSGGGAAEQLFVISKEEFSKSKAY